ncbi:MAG TPA: zf-HC2 domain-containing protein [Kofleriaceae bacterium]|nr:zf-HC2 domain-containing protein [Kofleriaceae bacterium]
MKQLCDSIETLAMALHDGELAGEELRDVELHLTECAPCREHCEREGAAISGIRRKLAPPPTPDLLRARVMKALDAEDKATRRPITSWLLPAGASLAAVAALAFFVVTSRDVAPKASVEKNIVASAARNRPPEVQGVATDQFIRSHFDPSVALPTFASARIDQWGARLTDVLDREAVQLFYRVTTPEGITRDLQVTIFDAHGIEAGGRRVDVNGRHLLVGTYQGYSVVTYRDGRDRAYVFTSGSLVPEELTDLVGTSSLLMQVRDDERFR